MRLSEKQQIFTHCVGKLIIYAYELPEQYEDVETIGFSCGDFWARTGHHPRSTHYAKVGADMSLFVDGMWIETYDQAPNVWDDLGDYWESLDELARWGGRFGDYGHFSFEHEGVR